LFVALVLLPFVIACRVWSFFFFFLVHVLVHAFVWRAWGERKQKRQTRQKIARGMARPAVVCMTRRFFPLFLFASLFLSQQRSTSASQKEAKIGNDCVYRAREQNPKALPTSERLLFFSSHGGKITVGCGETALAALHDSRRHGIGSPLPAAIADIHERGHGEKKHDESERQPKDALVAAVNPRDTAGP
jgi:hypothetical protein